MPEGLIPLLTAVFSIVVIDLVLSGDNAVVIGMAAHQLPPKQQRHAIIFGALGAVGLRVLFTALAAVLLGIPALQAIGGVVLIWIALKLLRQEEANHTVKHGTNLFDAVRTIVLADVVMSLDNILAVGGAAHGNIGLLLFGLGLSMPIILFGSSLVASLMNRLPWLVILGAAVLVYTGVEMTLADPLVKPYYPHDRVFEIGLALVVAAATIGLAHWLNLRKAAARAQAPAHALAEPASLDD
ncbi:MAG: TerC family protein [Chloroflexi bacterium]|nr:TerC family protein [Chloroflexota bacterium]